MFSLWKKETSSQKMQISIKSNTKISRNTNQNNYNNKIMWKRMMSNNNMSTTSLPTESSKKSSMNE